MYTYVLSVHIFNIAYAVSTSDIYMQRGKTTHLQHVAPAVIREGAHTWKVIVFNLFIFNLYIPFYF